MALGDDARISPAFDELAARVALEARAWVLLWMVLGIPSSIDAAEVALANGDQFIMAKSSASPHVVPIDSAPLLPVRRLPLGATRTGAPEASYHVVLCPMVGTEVVLQRCNFCQHGHEWIQDQATGQVLLRCSYLAQQT